jgi:fluoride ion exporter CrcB/FEX
VHAPTKLLDDCTFSTFSTFSFDHFSSIEKVIKLATLLAIGAFLFRVDDCTF